MSTESDKSPDPNEGRIRTADYLALFADSRAPKRDAAAYLRISTVALGKWGEFVPPGSQRLVELAMEARHREQIAETRKRLAELESKTV